MSPYLHQVQPESRPTKTMMTIIRFQAESACFCEGIMLNSLFGAECLKITTKLCHQLLCCKRKYIRYACANAFPVQENTLVVIGFSQFHRTTRMQ